MSNTRRDMSDRAAWFISGGICEPESTMVEVSAMLAQNPASKS
jgi:hypothetical protein